jgi:hypothetical protein
VSMSNPYFRAYVAVNVQSQSFTATTEASEETRTEFQMPDGIQAASADEATVIALEQALRDAHLNLENARRRARASASGAGESATQKPSQSRPSES